MNQEKKALGSDEDSSNETDRETSKNPTRHVSPSQERSDEMGKSMTQVWLFSCLDWITSVCLSENMSDEFF